MSYFLISHCRLWRRWALRKREGKKKNFFFLLKIILALSCRYLISEQPFPWGCFLFQYNGFENLLQSKWFGLQFLTTLLPVSIMPRGPVSARFWSGRARRLSSSSWVWCRNMVRTYLFFVVWICSVRMWEGNRGRRFVVALSLFWERRKNTLRVDN